MPNGHSHHHFIHLPHWDYPARLPGLTGLYFNATIRVFALGLVGIFIPVFVYQLTGSIEKVVLFFVIWKVFQLLMGIPCGWLISRIGPDNSIALSALIHIFFLVTLIFSLQNPSLLILAPFLGALTIPLHWIPYHSAFSKESDKRRLGQQVSKRLILQRLAASLAPFVGGLLAVKFGFRFLYLIAIILLIVSIFPIFMDQYNKKGRWFGGAKIIKGIFKKSFRPFLTAFLGTGLEAVVYSVFWPLFLLEKLGHLEKIGFVNTASLSLSVVALYWAGKEIKKKGNKLIRAGGIIGGLNWFVKSFFSSLSLLTLADILYFITTIFVWVPTGAIVYEKSQKKTATFFIRRELSIHTGFLIGLIASWLILSLTASWLLVFLVGALGIFMASRLKIADGQNQ